VQRLLDPNVADASGKLALVVAEEEVLMAFPAQDLMSNVGVLKPGDHVDLLFSLQLPTDRGVAMLLEPTGEEGEVVTGGAAGEGVEQFTFDLLQNLTIAALVGESESPQALLLTLTPQDALVLKYVKDAGGILDIVLRAPGAEQPFDVEPVDVDYILNRYQIPTQVGR
jgi:pilus assembly protein CpaB